MVGSALVLFLVLTSQAFADDPPLPDWPQQYSVAGVIQLPYANIKEPFQAWVDLTNNKSRIDYYDGTDKTFQIGPGGMLQFCVDSDCINLCYTVQIPGIFVTHNLRVKIDS